MKHLKSLTHRKMTTPALAVSCSSCKGLDQMTCTSCSNCYWDSSKGGRCTE